MFFQRKTILDEKYGLGAFGLCILVFLSVLELMNIHDFCKLI